jgi:hypothetical protein
VEFRSASARAIELEVDKADDGQSVDAAGRIEPDLAHGATTDKHGIDHLPPPCVAVPLGEQARKPRSRKCLRNKSFSTVNRPRATVSAIE